MRLVLVHGINQEGKSDASLKREWLTHLEIGLRRPGATAELDVVAPFYGDRLADLTSPRAKLAVAQGAADAIDPEESAFLAAALTEQAQAAGIGDRAIVTEARLRSSGDTAGAAIEQGFPMNRRINAIVRLLERISPLHGDLVMRFLREAYVYLKRPGAGGAIDAIVRPVLDAGPAVIVGHSLGTVVTFKLLRQLALESRPIQVTLYVTVGSPLPLMAVQAALGPAFSVPPGVGRWLNAVDPDDFIALGRGLDSVTFADGIENILDIKNVPGNPHSIEGYLRDSRVAAAIGTAVGMAG